MAHGIECEQLLAYAAGLLPAAEAEVVARHLLSHPADAATVAVFREVRETVQADHAAAPSAVAIARAKAVFRMPQVERKLGWLEVVDRLIARVIFDSRLQPAAVRSAALCDRINLSCQVEGMDIDLQAERSSGSDGQDEWIVIGEASPAGDQAVREAALVCIEGDRTVARGEAVAVDDDGGFRFSGIKAGTYDLLLRTHGGVIIVNDLRLE